MSLPRTYCRLALPVLASLLAMPAAAHHSFAMFDNTRSITLHGKVTLYQWTNPHAYLEVDAEQPGGGTLLRPRRAVHPLQEQARSAPA